MSSVLANMGFWPALATGSALVASAGWYVARLVSNSVDKTDKNTIILKDPMDVSQKSRLLPGPDRIRASIFCEKDDEFLTTDDPSVTTLYENFLYGLKLSNNGDCLGHRTGPNGEYQFISYQETLDRGHWFGAGLLTLGLEAGKSFIGIYSQNRAEWDIASIGCMSYSMAIIPLYDSLGADAVTFIVNQASIEIIVCDGVDKLKRLMENVEHMPSLKYVVVMDWSSNDQLINGLNKTVMDNGVKVHSFADITNAGKMQPQPLRLPKADDLYIICYTSGTTGNPKGVMIEHRNLLCQNACAKKIYGAYNIKFEVGDPLISYLPLAHMFEQMMHAIAFNYGAKIGYFSGNVNKLLDDMKALKPVGFPVVPRLLNKLYDKVQSNLAAGGPKKWLFDLAYRSKLAEMQKGIVRKNGFWDKLVFGKIQQELGGNVRIMFTGSAPISKEVLTLSRVMLGAVIMEGYGQTEATAAVTITLPTDMDAGHVGGVFPCCHIKLVDVPELQYFSSEDKGEICVRGACVTRGYFMEPEKTHEVLDDEGWLHTGDVGVWMPDNALKIIDRKKHIFKLAQGEYVAPEKIENIYLRCPYVAQIFVDGNSLQRSLVAVVIPEELRLTKWARDNNLGELDVKQLCARDDVKAMILKELQKIGKENRLNSIEQVRAIHLSLDPFTMENGLLTPTMKNKRPHMRKRYTSRVEFMYKSMVD